MKKLIFIIIICFETFVTFAQFGGGDGTAADPYQIYTKAHIDSMANQNTYGKFYILMNDITDTITHKICTTLAGSLNGKGHTLIVRSGEPLFTIIAPTAKLDSLFVCGYMSSIGPFCAINHGIIDFCTNNLNDSSTCNAGICQTNSVNGIISNCTNNLNITGNQTSISGICSNSSGSIQNCTNNGNITILGSNGNFAGISANGNGTIVNCINNGSIIQVGMGESVHLGGITRISTNSLIQNCINNGDISCKNAHCVGGIGGDVNHDMIIHCANYGNITGTATNAGGIVAWTDNDSIINCFNSGQIVTSSNNEATGSGIANIQDESLTIINCLNVGRCTEDGLVGSSENILAVSNSSIQNNYYDKQMCSKKGFSRIENAEFICYDSINIAEGKLTPELIGTSPELQAMLGDGWSYAEGRYPIPLGLENDSMALVAATPVYLHFEDEENYNHVDSVTSDFTVGLENNVSWNEAFGKVSFNNENATLLSFGTEILTVNLGNYSKNIKINIIDSVLINIQENITEKEIVISPNPAKSNFSIKASFPVEKIEIIGINGNLLYNTNCQGETEIKINTELWAKGIYFAIITTTDGEVITEKIIVE